MRILNKILYTCIIMLAIVASIYTVEAKALSDGVYIAPITVDYRNPETGVIEDGGSEENYQLGLSMCQSITYPQALIEVQNGRTYVTLRFTLMSNISSVSIATQSLSGGSYYNTAASVLNASGDLADYRFEVTDPSLYISPTMYVTPMGRNVRYFVKINVGSAVSGSGDFTTSISNSNTTVNNNINNSTNTAGTTTSNSNNITDEIQNNGEQVTENNSEENNEEVEEEILEVNKVEKEEINLEDEDGIEEYKVEDEEREVENKDKASNTKLIVSGVAVIILSIGAIIGGIIYKRRK